MHTSIWIKYLPIIRILLKRSASSQQTLELNISDFERAGLMRKSGNKFEILFSQGRADNMLFSDLAKSLAITLVSDAMVKELFMNNDYQFNLNTKYQLSIKMLNKVKTVSTDTAEELVDTSEVILADPELVS